MGNLLHVGFAQRTYSYAVEFVDDFKDVSRETMLAGSLQEAQATVARKATLSPGTSAITVYFHIANERWIRGLALQGMPAEDLRNFSAGRVGNLGLC